MSNVLMNKTARRLAVALGVTACLAFLPGDAPTAQVGSASGAVQGVSPQVIAQMQGLMREKALRSRTQRKISSQLIYARRMARREAVAQGVTRLDVNVPTATDGRVIVDVRATVTASLIQRLQNAGVTILSAEPNAKAMRLQATLEQIEEIAANDDVDFVRPTLGAVTNRYPGPAEAGRHDRVDREALKAAVRRAMLDQGAITQAGSVTSQGDATHAASTARSTNVINGTGVKIGVLSDGVTSRAASLASGDLPSAAGALTIVPGQAGSGDEGTAMLEIIHDLAPGAQLYFATAFTSITSFADNIRTLRNTYGCDIIVDDVFYYVESPFQDGQAASVTSTYNSGVVTQAVKDVTAAGALYFSSAGNSGNLNDGTSGAWEGDFVNGGALTIPGVGDYQVHSFGTQNFNVLTANGLRVLTLYWADALGASANDYDLFLLNSAGTAIVAASVDAQDGTQDPFEAVGFSSGAGTNLRVLIGKYSGSSRFLHLSTNRGTLSIATAGEIHGHAAANATNAFAVAATPAAAGAGSTGPYPGRFSTGNKVETFSSDGPRRIFFNADGSAITAGNFSSTGGQVLTKPDLTAADGVSVTGAGGFPSPFYGTSAAAPHAAAIAALIKSANLSLTAAQVRTALLNSALDIEASGTDRDSGVGIVMADTAVQSVIGPLMAVDSPAAGASVVQPFTLLGWAIDRAASNSAGVSGVHIWAHPVSGSPTFVGEATYGSTRSDIGTAYGARFAASGFSRTVSGLAPGTYTLVASAFSTVTNTFNQSASITVTIPVSLPAMSIDSPANGSSPGLSFTLLGWAIDRTAASGSGVDAIHVYAYPSTGSGFGAGTFAGAATLGFSRTDVGAVYGSQFNNSGYQVPLSLSAGTYRLIAYVHSSVTGTFVTQQSVDITAAAPASNPAMSLDGPTEGQTVSQPFVTGGWAVDRGASNGTGVDAIHVWAFPLVNGVVGAGRFVDQATLNGGRSDVAAVFGAQFQNSGFNFLMTGLTPGTYIIGVYCRSGVTGTFNQQRFVTVTVQ